MDDALETIRGVIAGGLPAGVRPYALGLLSVIAFTSAVAVLLNPIVTLWGKLFPGRAETPVAPPPAARRWRVSRPVAVGLAVAAVMAGGLAVAIVALPAPEPRTADGCLADRASPAALLIVLDRAGRISGVERAAVDRLVADQLRRLPSGAWVGLVGVEDHENEIALAYGGCVAAAPREAKGGLGRRQAEAGFMASVQAPVGKAVAAVLAKTGARARGPIIETMLNAARAPGFSGATGERTVLLISEGRQNTYKARLDYRDRDDIHWPAGGGLAGAKMLFFQVHGDDQDALQARAPGYWRAFAMGSGAGFSVVQ